EKAYPFLRGGVTGMPLEPADRHRGFDYQVVHARPFTQDLGGASAGAAAAEDVGLQDRLGGADGVLVQELADELGNINVGRAGADAGGVEAVQAARRLDQYLIGSQRRRQVRKIARQLRLRQPLTRFGHHRPLLWWHLANRPSTPLAIAVRTAYSARLRTRLG